MTPAPEDDAATIWIVDGAEAHPGLLVRRRRPCVNKRNPYSKTIACKFLLAKVTGTKNRPGAYKRSQRPRRTV